MTNEELEKLQVGDWIYDKRFGTTEQIVSIGMHSSGDEFGWTLQNPTVPDNRYFYAKPFMLACIIATPTINRQKARKALGL